MADFWSNFAEAMGWGKANHTQHLSNISDEKKQEYRNRYADAANKSYEKDNPGAPKIENAKQNGGDPLFTRDDDDFVGEYNSDNDDNYETRIYNFKYAAPTNGKGVDDGSTELRSGKVLVRAPKYKESVSGGFGSKSPWFDDEEFLGSNIGVYEAVLDDGTVLDADQFKDLVQTNQYGQFKLGTQESTDKKASDRLQIFKNYKDKLNPREHGTKWDKNWRGWKSGPKDNWFITVQPDEKVSEDTFIIPRSEEGSFDRQWNEMVKRQKAGLPYDDSFLDKYRASKR